MLLCNTQIYIGPNINIVSGSLITEVNHTLAQMQNLLFSILVARRTWRLGDEQLINWYFQFPRKIWYNNVGFSAHYLKGDSLGDITDI